MAKFTYPEPVVRNVGCKVMWYYYDDEGTALKAAKVAEEEADYRWAQGFDFGYLVPGTVRKVPDDSEKYAGLWEVVLP